ncbi:hypothetical protein [Dietzia kunjamensis]|uniref:hypothetical protein n=1 Tax=Dietzia kunjamensis TaxID=322509 RepID=UPI0032AE8A43
MVSKLGARHQRLRERDLLDLLALSAQFPAALVRAYMAIAEDPDRRARYLQLWSDSSKFPAVLLLSMPFLTEAADISAPNLTLLGTVLLAGIALTITAVLACGPVETRILNHAHRRND